MTDEMIALARRAVACKGWRWMVGMLTHDGYRMLWCSETEREWAGPHFTEAGMAWRYARIHGEPNLPDLSDAATLGCLLALVREAWGCAVITAPDYDDDEEGAQGPLVGWRAVETVRWISVSRGTTEAGALVAALEAAP